MRRIFAALLVTCTLPFALDGATTPYQELDNVEDTWVNQHPVPLRPMAVTDDSLNAYVLNTQLDTIVHVDPGLEPLAVFRTLRGPVSIALYEPPETEPDDAQLLVVCTLSEVLVRHRRSDGEILEIVPLPAEPSDLLVDQATHTAWVSSGATDVVVEIDLLDTRGPLREYAIPARNPQFLSQTADGEVLVAARWSGNNSAVHRRPPTAPNSQFDPLAGERGVLDLADPTVATPPGLPDEDLFWLDRDSGRAVAVARGTGTILLAHGQNPATGEYWMLNTEANNKDPQAQNEPAIRGFISANRLTRFDLPSPLGAAVVGPPLHKYTDLDLANPSGDYDRATAVGTPYSLAFSTTGLVLVAGLLTDNLTLLGSEGEWLVEWDLPEGCIPRQVILDTSEQFISAYCSGTNQVVIYFSEHIFLDGGPPIIGTIDVGYDPTPAAIREGRKVFFDASHSLNNNHSCATCHDEGRLDMPAWDLSSEVDDKGPMVTQSLTALNRLVPFHWRGEQQNHLIDFNAAFDGLLGGTPLDTGPGSDFEHFERWVLSLENPANPYASAERLVDDTIQPPRLSPDQAEFASAIRGQTDFFSACSGCHAAPAGTSNSMVADGLVFGEPQPRRQWFKTAHLLHLWMRGLQPDVAVEIDGERQVYPRGGVGLAHAGNPRNIFHFADFFVGDASNMTSFMFQFDTGFARATHAAELLNADTVDAVSVELEEYLLPQADLRHCDIGVFGRTEIDGGERLAGWHYDRESGDFIRDDGRRQSLDFFIERARTTHDWFAFAGLPVGVGRGWAIDADRDDLFDALEERTSDGADGRYVVDTDGDSFWDGHESANHGDPFDPLVTPNDTTPPATLQDIVAFQWTTTRVGRLTFETDEPTRASLVLDGEAGVPQLEVGTELYKRQHNLIVDRFTPGATYHGELIVTDLAGNISTRPVSVESDPVVEGFEVVIVGDLSWREVVEVDGDPTNLDFTVVGRIDRKLSLPELDPVANRVIAARVFVNGMPLDRHRLTSEPSGLCIAFLEPSTEPDVPPELILRPYEPSEYPGVPDGPFVISSASDEDGTVKLDFRVSDLARGDEVELSIELVSEDSTVDCELGPALGSFTHPTSDVPRDWSFPDTLAPFRTLTYVVP